VREGGGRGVLQKCSWLQERLPGDAGNNSLPLAIAWPERRFSEDRSVHDNRTMTATYKLTTIFNPIAKAFGSVSLPFGCTMYCRAGWRSNPGRIVQP
jgi:hypothetical protein